MGPCDDVRVAVQATLAWEGEGSDPRAQRGPVAGATTKFPHAPSIGVFGFVPVWARSIFSSSCVVVRAWCLWVWWPGACGVLAAGARARRAACAGCVPRSSEAAGSAIAQSKELKRLHHDDVVRIRVTAPSMRTVAVRPGVPDVALLPSLRLVGRSMPEPPLYWFKIKRSWRVLVVSDCELGVFCLFVEVPVNWGLYLQKPQS